MSSFNDKTVLITGASSGIGAAVARELARQGAKLVLVARRLDRLEQLESDLKAQGARVAIFEGDVSRDGDLERVVSLARESMGPADVVIANAGFGVVGRFDELSLEDYRRQFETNIFGVIRTVQATLSDLKQTRGRLALVGSVNGYVALPGNSPYSMSKFAVRALAESLYQELLPHGISVTHIAPGFVDSEIRQVDNRGIHHGRAKDPIPAWIRMKTDTAARKIVGALASRRRECVITGHGKFAVWVERHLPWFLHLMIRSFGIRARGEAERG